MKFQVIFKKMLALIRQNYYGQNDLFYINGSDVLPAPLSHEEEQIQVSRLITGDRGARDTLIEHNLRLVVYIARKFEISTLSCSIEDLISIGTIGLIKAVNTYCPGKILSLPPTLPVVSKTKF